MVKKIGNLVLALGISALIIMAVLLGVARAKPDVFASNTLISIYVLPYLSVIQSIGIFLSVLGVLMADILGFSLIDIAKNILGKSKRLVRSVASVYFPFQIITETNKVLPFFLPGPGLLPDYQIPYQRRLEDRNITEELRNLLFRKKQILIAGKGGIGKTREVAKLLSDLVDEGYTVLLAESSARFNIQVNFPERPRHRLIFVFDDLHQNCATPPVTSLDEKFSTEDFLSDLQHFVQIVQSRYTSSEVHIIFLSRKDIDTWNYLLFPHHPIWRNVELYEMPEPSVASQKNLILGIAEKLDLNIQHQEALAMAEANDGTFRNLAQNLYRAKRESIQLNAQNFSPIQGITWSDRYEFICEKYPLAIHILESLVILTKIGITPREKTVIYLTQILKVGLRLHQISKITELFLGRRVSKLIKQLELEGDLKLDKNTNKVTTHEFLLKAHQNRHNDYSSLLPILWNYVKRWDDSNAWFDIASYAIYTTKQFYFGVIVITYYLKFNRKNINARLLRCEGLIRLGLLEYALKDAEIAHQIDSQSSNALIFSGVINTILGKQKLAREYYESALDLNPTSAEVFLNQSSLSLSESDYKSAKKYINKAIELEPERLELYMFRAEINWAGGEHSEAFSDLDFILKEKPDFIAALLQKAEFYISSNKLNLAETQLQRVLSVNTYRSEALYLQAYIAYLNSNLWQAEKLLTEAISISPHKALYYYRRASVRFKLHKIYEAMEDMSKVEKYASKEKERVEYQALRVTTQLEEGNIKLADKNITGLLENKHLGPNEYLAIADALRQHQQSQKALEILNHCIRRFPDSDQAYHNRAHLHAVSKRTDLALKDFNRAIHLAPRQVNHLVCKSGFLIRQKEHKEAIRLLALTLKFAPDDVDLHIRYLSALNQQKKIRGSIEEKYLRQLAKQPDSLPTLVALSYISWWNQNYKAMQTYVTRLLQMKLEERDVVFYLIWLILTSKNLMMLSKLFRSTPNNILMDAMLQFFSPHNTQFGPSLISKILMDFTAISINWDSGVVFYNWQRKLRGIFKRHHKLTEKDLMLD